MNFPRRVKLTRTYRILIAALLVVFLVTDLRAQRRKKIKEPRTARELAQESENHHCKVTNRYSAEERRANYPFSAAAEIRLVSFTPEGDDFGMRLPVDKNGIDYSKIRESRVLNAADVDSLTFLLYNIDYKGQIYFLEAASCYNPHNAILFYDNENNLLEYIEICFECLQERLSSEKIVLGSMCFDKYDYLRLFMRRRGLLVGTDKSH
jgi:hypothetical protein